MTERAAQGTQDSQCGRERSALAPLRLDSYLPYRLSVASNAVSRLIAKAYEDRFGLTIPQWRLIAVLAEDGRLTQQAIGARTVMDKVSVSRATQGLVKRRLVQRAPHNADGRSHHVMLSKAGVRLYEEISPVALAVSIRPSASTSRCVGAPLSRCEKTVPAPSWYGRSTRTVAAPAPVPVTQKWACPCASRTIFCCGPPVLAPLASVKSAGPVTDTVTACPASSAPDCTL